MTVRSEAAEQAIATLAPAAEAYERSKRPGVRLASPGPLERLALGDEPEQTALDVDPQLGLDL